MLELGTHEPLCHLPGYRVASVTVTVSVYCGSGSNNPRIEGMTTSLMSLGWKSVAGADQNNPKQLWGPQIFWPGMGFRFVCACGQVGTPVVSSHGTQV